MSLLTFEQLVPKKGWVIGEIACGHDGKYGQLEQLIDGVADAGAPIVKFQIFKAAERAIEGQKAWDIFSKLELPAADWEKAVAHARRRGLYVFADIFGKESLSLAQALGIDGFKIHAEDMLNSCLIAEAASTGKIVLIGVGSTHRLELYKLVHFLKAKDLLGSIVLIPGVQTFPTPVQAHSISMVSDLTDKYACYGVKVGFSDHVSGDLAEAKMVPLMALANGAVILEKHVTLDRQLKWTDYQSALGKEDFKDFIRLVKELSPLLAPVKPLNAWERQYRQMFKKSPCAARDLPAGHVVKEDDIIYRKNTQQVISLAGLDLVGQQINESVQQGKSFSLSHLRPKVGIVIVARCTSSRLSNKAMLPVHGRESIALVIDRMKRCQKADCIILATSTDPSDDALADIAKREGILLFRGSLDDVALRFYEAARAYKLDQIVRVTGDALLCDETMVDRIIDHQMQQCSDVTFMGNMPYGTAKEIFSFQTIEVISKTACVPQNTEYLEWFLGNSRYFNVSQVASDYVFDPRLRITLDYIEDLLFFDEVYGHFHKRQQPDFTLKDALMWLAKTPEVAKINMHKMPKYTIHDVNVQLKI